MASTSIIVEFSFRYRHTTLWLFREKLAKAGLIEKLLDRFDQHLAAQGYMAVVGRWLMPRTVVTRTRR